MTPRFQAALAAAGLLLAAAPLPAQPSWQEELAKMPLTEKAPELNRHNCVRIMLGSFRRNPAVQALIFMPGATDEFYFFRRARAALTNASPTLLDAVEALTNQTYIRATLSPPFLLLHTAEDPLEPLAVVEDQRAADRIRKKSFEKQALFDDRDWDFMQPILAFDLNTHISPGRFARDSSHFFRHSLAEFDLTGWDALRAVALAGKTKFTVKKKRIVFEGDKRYLALPANLTPDFLLNPDGESR
jgi:hypothetical protein